jgi:lysozyme family protein
MIEAQEHLSIHWNDMLPKYKVWLDEAKVLRAKEADFEANKIIHLASIYNAIAEETGVPAVWIACINYRESGNSLHRYFGNGDWLYTKTVHVPKGRGPFKTFAEGCIDAIEYMHLYKLAPWTLEFFCYASEKFNGWGYELYHHIPSPYVFGGTSVQKAGKYDHDGHYNPHVMDKQLGVIALYYALIAKLPNWVLPRAN